MEALTADEAFVLRLYREVRKEGNGTLFIQFIEHRAKSVEHKLGSGALELNRLLELNGKNERTRMRENG